MTTDTPTTYELLIYRCEAEDSHCGCCSGDRYSSSIDWAHSLTLEQLRERIINETAAERFEGDDPPEFCIFIAGIPIATRGPTFYDKFDCTQLPESALIEDIFEEAALESEQRKKERREQERKKQEEESRRFREAEERRALERARETIKQLEPKYGGA